MVVLAGFAVGDNQSKFEDLVKSRYSGERQGSVVP